MALISTKIGEVDEALLERRYKFIERPSPHAPHSLEIADEWWKDGEIVKRNVHIILLQPNVIKSMRIAP